MFTLERDARNLRLVGEKAGDKLVQVAQQPFFLQNPYAFWRHCSPAEKKEWLDFVSSGRVQPGAVSPVILESWTRCLQAEVEFAGGKCGDVLSPKELENRQNLLLEVADPLMETLFHCVRGFGFVIVLVDSDGYVLKSIGDLESLRRAERINFGPGANWSELSVGTNAIGTALTVGRSMQVTGPEHFNDGHHCWTCAATPIRDPSGALIGCLDISGPRENAGVRILDMTLSAVGLIEKRLRQDQSHNQMLRANRLMSLAMDSISEGVISVSAGGVIDGVNSPAAKLLGLDRIELIGRKIDSTLPAQSVERLLLGRNDGTGEVLALNAKSGRRRLLASAQPAPRDLGAGAMITLKEISREAAQASRKPVCQIRYTFDDIIGQSPVLLEAKKQARMAAAGPSTILILGESGVGKEVFAQAIHNAGPRRGAPFVSINCGAIPRELIQSELFGYSEGAFTGARRGGCRGKIELADGGVLFLDEIADMPLDLQANLLRVLEEKAFIPLGGEREIETDIRVIAATNRCLDREVEAGRFRRDLYYRLKVVVLEIPPLREREGDARLLAEHHLRRLALKMDKIIRRIDPGVFDALDRYNWPGNVRELINVLEQSLNFMTGDNLLVEYLPDFLKPRTIPKVLMEQDEIIPLESLEKFAIEHALNKCRRNISQTAQALGIGRNTLYSKMKKYGIPPGRGPGSPLEACS
ncbi:MAG: sigma-54-dependent Fis family transcriptional regulator [Pseudomonadota bacterium]